MLKIAFALSFCIALPGFGKDQWLPATIVSIEQFQAHIVPDEGTILILKAAETDYMVRAGATDYILQDVATGNRVTPPAEILIAGSHIQLFLAGKHAFVKDQDLKKRRFNLLGTEEVAEQKLIQQTRDNCQKAYVESSHKKQADLTLRELESIKSCRTMGMIP